MSEQPIDWDRVEQEQKRVAEPFDIGRKPLLVSDWRDKWRSAREAGVPRNQMLKSTHVIYDRLPDEDSDTGVARDAGHPHPGSLTRRYVLALFADEWPEDVS
jgi:hypothetical protein